jgi:exopolysaccharide biosynthesis polyprenyl glycosylphosphotransferase
VEIDDIEGITVLGINPPVLPRSSRLLKRAMDLMGALLLLLLTAPLFTLIAVCIKLDSPGPVFFRQERIGLWGRRFRLFKFRTMTLDAEQRRGALLIESRDPGWLLLEEDPRVTRVGRFLRRSSLDELPQLWNVLKGEMSLVGPRPIIPSEDSQLDGWRTSRVDLTPGLTGLWQVLGRTSVPFDEMIRLDYVYVTNWSLWTDVRLMLRTLPAVLRRRGAN